MNIKFELHDNKISITTYSVKSTLMPILHFASMEEAAKFHRGFPKRDTMKECRQEVQRPWLYRAEPAC